MPDQEFWVPVDIGHVQLMQAREILIARGGRGEIARRGLAHHAFYGGDEGESVGGWVGAPFDADVGVCAARGFGCCCGDCCRGFDSCMCSWGYSRVEAAWWEVFAGFELGL